MDDVLWSGVDVLSNGQDIAGLRKMVLVSVMRRHFQTGDAIVGLDSPSTLLAKLSSHDLSTVADIAKGKTGIKDAKPGPYPLVVTAEARSECDHFDYEGPAVLIPMVSSTGHGDASLKRIHYQEGQYAVGTILAVVRPLNPSQLSARYLYEYLSAFKEELLVSRMVGTANVSLTVKKLGDVPVPMIPIASQRQIERLMALCDRLEADQADAEAAHAQLVQALLDSLTQATDAADFRASWQRLSEHFHALFTTEASIDGLKQTVLQLAFSGRLTCGVVDVNDMGSRDDELPALPYGWRYARLGDVAKLINGDRGSNYPNRSEYVEQGLPFINTGHINPDGSLDLDTMNYISREKFDSLRSGKIERDDLVYCLRGATLGKTAFVAQFTEGAVASSLVILRFNRDVSRRYAYYFLTSPIGRRWIRKFDNGSAQPNLAANSVKEYLMPIPPLAEQHRIVAKVDELIALCDQLKAQLADARQQHAQLATVLVEHAVA
ncbi:MAG: restriction endonuclease subunit S [Rubrivivax sp.]|nr:MAG: restriction endonuclease subunit S [Rubrivivax sp.]